MSVFAQEDEMIDWGSGRRFQNGASMREKKNGQFLKGLNAKKKKAQNYLHLLLFFFFFFFYKMTQIEITVHFLGKQLDTWANLENFCSEIVSHYNFLKYNELL